MNRECDDYTIDMAQIFKALWRKIWLIGLVATVVALAGFSCARFWLTPQYAACVTFYVNNDRGNESSGISSSDISASQQLVKTYGTILTSRSVLEKVIEKTGLSYSCEDLRKMICSESVNGTEVMSVTVTAVNPEEAATIANCIAQVLPARIEKVIKNSSMEVIDYASIDRKSVGPSTVKYTVIGFLLGAGIAVLIVAVIAVFDDRIYDGEYIIRSFACPVLEKIPRSQNKIGTKTEHYKRLCVHLDFLLDKGDGCPAVGIVGSLPEDGATMTAFELAGELSERGKKVLLVNWNAADLRDDFQNEKIHRVSSAEIMKFPNTDAFLADQKACFDFILLDLPSVNESADCLSLSKQTDGLILSIREGYSRKTAWQQCIRQLRIADAKILGCAINCVK